MLSTNSPAQGSQSPDQPAEALSVVRKRKRKAYSCYACRSRKLKCDREQPACARCRKSGVAESCSYDERPLQSDVLASHPPGTTKPSVHETQATSPWSYPTPVSQSKQITRLENRLSTLEEFSATQTAGTWQMMGEISTGPNDGLDSKQRPAFKADIEECLSSPRPTTPPETIIFRGENFKTQYYGGSNPTSLIAHFPELRLFMRDAIMQHTSLPRVQRDLKTLQVKWKEEKNDVLPLTDMELLQLLPNRETVDHLARLYFSTFGSIYPVLHAPSFWKQYDMLWDGTAIAKPSFTITIFLMMAAVSCLSLEEQPTYVADSSMARERAALWIEFSERWLSRQSQKRLYLGIWQIRCLLMIAKQVNIVKKKKTWILAGSIVKEAMAAGFHRDPSLLGAKVSAFDQEMRRRVWLTITELELQASIDRGLPSSSGGVPSDCANILNVHDEDLGIDLEDRPVQRPTSEHTSTSYLHIARASFPLRVTLNSIVNDISSPSRYEDVLNHEELIREQLKKIPSGLPVLIKTLLDVQLRQFLILLHSPFAREAGSNSRYALSRMICFNAAAEILDQYTLLVRSQNYMLLLQRHDYFRAALAISHNLHISMSIKNDLYLASTSNTFVTYLENALTLLEDRITRIGTGYTHHWYVSAACALIRSEMSPDQTTAQKQQAIDRVARQYYKILGSQVDLTKAKQTLLPHRVNLTSVVEEQLQRANGDANPAAMPFLDSGMPQPVFNDPELPMDQFYFGDPAAWTFDNLWDIGDI